MMNDDDATRRTVWLVHCHWDKPYFIENQWDLLGAFSSQARAEEAARRHEAYAANDWYHKSLNCTCEIKSIVVDEDCYSDE